MPLAHSARTRNVIRFTPISPSLPVSSCARNLRVVTWQTVITTPVSIWNKRLVCWPHLGTTADRLRYWLGRDAKPPVEGREDIYTFGGAQASREQEQTTFGEKSTFFYEKLDTSHKRLRYRK